MTPAFSPTPAFFRFWLSQIATSSAMQMLTVAVGWQIYDLTGRALDLGLVGLCQFAPQFLLTLAAGDVADRFDRGRTVAACQLTLAAGAVILAAVSVLGLASATVIFACAVLSGAARAFEMPAMQALLPNLVDTAELPRALALNASARQTACIAGPALGGALYLLGPTAAYGVCAALFVLAALAMAGVPRRGEAVKLARATVRSLLSGIEFIFARPVILGAISMDLFAVLFGGATAILPVYAKDILEVGPVGLGALRAAPAVGALAMAVFLAKRPLTRGAGRLMFSSVAAFGAGTIVFGLSRSFFLSLAALAFLGAVDMVSVVIRQTLVQLKTPDDMRGRVSAVNAVFIGTSNQLGEFESGLAAALLGIVPSVVFGGAATLVVAALWMRLFPDLRAMDRLSGDGGR